jgi:oligopeptidase B
MYAMGGSAGGLLMGAVMNMAPSLFNGVIAAVPFVDVINTMLDESIPLTTGNLTSGATPRTRRTSTTSCSTARTTTWRPWTTPTPSSPQGTGTAKVQYWEPAKWIAKLRDVKTDDNLLIMDCNMETGHGGASGRFERIKEVALEYAFMFMLEGIDE